MKIKALQKLTLIDYPGQLACTVFVFGCNYRCFYCHNPELIVEENTTEVEQKDFLKFLEDRKGFLDAVCITGGEPTLYNELKEFIAKIKQMGFLVKLDTNGSNPQILKELINNKMVDYIAMDIKAPLDRYEEIAKQNVDKEKIKQSVELLKSCGVDYEFRTTVPPELDEKDFVAIGEWLRGAKRYFLQQFRTQKMLDKDYTGKPYDKEKLEEFCGIMKQFVENCGVRS